MTELILPTDLLEPVNNVAEKHKFDNFTVELKGTNVKGEGFLGEIFFVNIADKNTKRSIDVVIKKAFSSEKIRAATPIAESFHNEIYFYTKVLPSFKKLQDNGGIKNKFDNYPKCWLTSIQDEHEILILENLKISGYEIFDKKTVLDGEHMKNIFKIYGRYHALSLAYKQENKEEYSNLENGLSDIWGKFFDTAHFQGAVVGISKLALSILEKRADKKVVESFKKYGENSMEHFKQSSTYVGNYSVITHGDCWSNNMMFKYDDQRKLTDIKLIDFQIVRCGTPVFDLSYCLYSGVGKDVLDNLDEYLKIYHNSLSEVLQEFGYDSAKLYPFKVLKEEWKTFSKFGMFLGIILTKMKLTDTDDVIDLHDIQDFESGTDEETSRFVNARCDTETFEKRIVDLITHMYNIGAL